MLKGVRGGRAGQPRRACRHHREGSAAGQRLPRNRRARPQSGLRHREGRDRGRRAHRRATSTPKEQPLPAGATTRSSRQMNRIMKPKAVAVIGASAEDGKIGNSVMKNLINGGYKGTIYPIHPKADEIMGLKAYQVGARTCPARSTSRCSRSRRSSCAQALDRSAARRRSPARC